MVDLASEAVLGALADGGVTMKDMGVIGAGNLMAANAGIGQQLQKQLGQTGIPVYNVANACATGATALRVACMAVKAGEADMGLAFGVEKLSGAGLLAGGSRKEDSDTYAPSGRYGAVAADRRADRHRDHARGLRPDRHGVRPPLRRHQLRALRPDQREEPRPLDAQPAGRLHEADVPRGDHGRRHDRLPQHPADVLGQLRRRGRGRGGERCEAEDALAGAAAAGGQDLRLDPDHRPVGGGLPDPARRQHPDPQRGRPRPTSRPASGPPTSTWSSCTTASPRPSWSTTTTSCCARQGGAVDFFNSGATWRDGKTPVNVSGGLESKGHPIAATGIANVWEVATHLRGEAGDRQIAGAKVGLTHVIGLGSACGVHILEKAA